jgi:hypothetical protein
MATKTLSSRVECLNPNTGRRMNIDKDVYDLFSKAIYHSLKKDGPLTYTQMVEGIKDYFKQQKYKFEGSISWYAVTVKHDMHTRGFIEVYSEKGKKLHALKKQS